MVIEKYMRRIDGIEKYKKESRKLFRKYLYVIMFNSVKNWKNKYKWMAGHEENNIR